MTVTAPTLDTAQILVVGSTEWLEAFTDAVRSQTGASVRAVSNASEALDTVGQISIDCVVTEYTLREKTGVELVNCLKETTPSTPIILGTTAGSEAVASEAIRAGVTDYIAVTESADQTMDDLIERTADAVRIAEETTTRDERAQQFEAVFQDTQTATWVLDRQGSLKRVNQPAREMIDQDCDALIGETFWTLPWWDETETARQDVRQLVAEAREGQFSNVVVFQAPANPHRVLDLSVRPVKNDRGDLVSIVVEGIDVSEQVRLQRDLQESEELHRVTLKNMTDTVLITNDDGEYTYVCPNVHFIFGYTAEEIYEQETIDELIGENLFDRDDLAENRVLKNIECTATDKAGREHTLLVNVREVDIQGGSVLYSCRDITKRKQREEALATLQELARSFLYAGTHDEIAQHIVEDSSNVIGVEASAVYLFDADANELRPAAHSQTMRDLHGPLPRVHADGDTLPGHGFITGSTQVFENIHNSDRLENRATDLRSACYIPLGDHGVFVAGSDAVGAFDDVTRELADLLAAAAEAALDRVTRESTLRTQERQLQQQNDQLTTLNQINETIRAIDRAVVEAESREEIDHAVCDLLTSDDRFRFAWIGTVDPTTETLEARTWAGNEQGYLDGHQFAVGASGTEPAGQTAATDEVTMVPNVAADLREDSWRTDALRRDFMSVLSIPLVYNDLTYGVLTVYASTRDAFDEMAQTVLTELGETIAAALSAIERKNALLTTSITRLVFGIEDSTFILSRLAREADCTLTYKGGVQQTTDRSYVFVTVDGAAIETLQDSASGLAGIDDVQPISADTDGGVLRLGLTEPFLALELADHGAVFREAVASPTETTLTIDAPERVDGQTARQLVTDTFADVTLQSKQTLDQAFERDIHAQFLGALTDRQLEVTQTAYYSGFFESPRESTGEEVAALLGISPPAFYQHIRTVQRKLFTAVFEEANHPVAGQTEQVE
ncbi:bacterio-opsin activator domain-containing protein [Haloarcula laminariae]|uniref:bacterio-opsin activator domain-containing protein n=1 Tax=Haloarcula laminariae TaxID=2961577 RepID=UPI0021C8C838|nr:bacterio-opsin activator domain-containing protein [Halomicroarcula laminariae]